MDKKIGAGGIFAIIVGIITLGGAVSIGMLRKAVGTILIMLVGIYAVSNVKGDFFSMIKDFSARSEAADIRRLEFERERLKLEAETKLKVLEIESKRAIVEQQAIERARIQQEKQAALAAKTEAENKISVYKQSLINDGFKLFEKTNLREIHYKFLPVRWENGNKIISAEVVLNRNELTTADNGIKWHSERLNTEINCWNNTARLLNNTVHNGPWNTGEVVMTIIRTTDWAQSRDWQNSLGARFC